MSGRNYFQRKFYGEWAIFREAVFLGSNCQGGWVTLLNGNCPGGNYPGGNHPGGNCPGRNYLGDNFPRGQLSGHPFKIIYCFQNSLKLIKIFSSVSENNTVVNIILQTIKGSRKNWGIIFFSVEFKHTHKEKRCFPQFSARIYWNRRMAASDLFQMFTKPVKCYIFHCHMLKSSGVHQIERSVCSFQQHLWQNFS